MQLDSYLSRMEMIAIPVLHGSIPSDIHQLYNARKGKGPVDARIFLFDTHMFLEAARNATANGKGKAEQEIRLLQLELALRVCSDKMNRGQWESILQQAALCTTTEEKYKFIGAFLAQYGYTAEVTLSTVMNTLGLTFRKRMYVGDMLHAMEKANKNILQHPMVADIVEWYAMYMKDVFKVKK